MLGFMRFGVCRVQPPYAMCFVGKWLEFGSQQKGTLRSTGLPGPSYWFLVGTEGIRYPLKSWHRITSFLANQEVSSLSSQVTTALVAYQAFQNPVWV